MPSNDEMKAYLAQEKVRLDAWKVEIKNAAIKQERDSGKKQPPSIDNNLHEFLERENTLVSNMLDIKIKLENPDKPIPHTTAQQAALDHYLKQIDAFLASYQSVELVGKVMNGPQSVEGLMQSIDEVMASKSFEQYIGHLKVLAHAQKNIDTELGALHSNLGYYSIQPAQRIGRYPLTFADKEFSKDYLSPLFRQHASSCLAKGKEIASRFDDELGQKDAAQWAIDHTQASDLKVRQVSALRDLIAVKFNNPLAAEDQDARMIVKYQNSYITKLLSRAYPDLFSVKQNNQLEVAVPSRDPTYNLIYKAFGIDLLKAAAELKFDAAKVELKFDAAKLDVAALQSLYKEDGNLLWLALKSAAPINARFSAEEKIESYLALALALKEGKIGDTAKYLQAAGLAKAAFAIAAEHPDCQAQVNKDFGSESDMGKWIIDKYKEHRRQIEPSERVKLLETLTQYGRVDLSHNKKYGFDLTDMPEDQVKLLKASLKTLFADGQGNLKARDEGNGFKIKTDKKGVAREEIVGQLRDALLKLQTLRVNIRGIEPDDKTSPREAMLLLQAKAAALAYLQLAAAAKASEVAQTVAAARVEAPPEASIARTTKKEDDEDSDMEVSQSRSERDAPSEDSEAKSAEAQDMFVGAEAVLPQASPIEDEVIVQAAPVQISVDASRQLELQLSQLQLELAAATNELAQEKEEVVRFRVANQALEASVGQLSQNMSALQAANQQQSAELERKYVKIQRLNQVAEESRVQLEEQKKVNSAVTSRLAEVEGALATTTAINGELGQQLEAAQANIVEQDSARQALKQELRLAQENVVQNAVAQQGEMIALQGQVAQLAEGSAAAMAKNKDLEQQLQAATLDSVDKDLVIQKLNGELEVLRVSAAAPAVVLQVNQQQLDAIGQKDAEIQQLKQENEALKAAAAVPIVVPVVNPQQQSNLQQKKSELLVQFGAVQGGLVSEDSQSLRKRIDDVSDDTVESLETDIASLKVSQQAQAVIDSVVKDLLKRDRWYTSGPGKKVEDIQAAFKKLTPDEKAKFVELKEEDIDKRLKQKDNSPLGKLLQAIGQNRSIIAVNEATSVSDFKAKLKEINPVNEAGPNPNGPARR